MFRAEPADFNFDIAGHNWFIDEHFWTSLIQRWTLLASSKQAKTMKKVKKVFFSNIYAEETRNRKFQNNFNGLFWKLLKRWFFPKTVFSFDSMSENFLTRTKEVKDTKISPAIGKKILQELISMFLQCFCACANMKSLRQQCSWLDQKKSVMFRAELVFFRNDAEKISYQSWFSIVQNSSESIRRSRIMPQVLFPTHILGGGGGVRNYV